MKKYEAIYNKLRKKYTDEEIADSMLIPEDLSEEESKKADEELRAVRFKLLTTTWKDLLARYTINSELTKTLWQEIEKAYSAPKRHYHNLQHLQYMTERAFPCLPRLTDPDTLLFSIFYHDIVYNVKRRDNEARSAELALDRLTRLGLPADKRQKCREQILATKAHTTHTDEDNNYLVDFDLAILGDTSENYRDYARKIRKEYAVYPDFLYKPGRKKVLRHFLEMERIFKTDEFHDRLERQARENLEMELIVL